MQSVSAAALLLLCVCATVSALNSTAGTVLTAAPGDVARLPCYSAGNVTRTVTTWTKDGRQVAAAGDGSTPGNTGERLTVMHDGSLAIDVVTAEDQGTYTCSSTLPGNITYHNRVLLHVTGRAVNVSVSIGPATALSNGTHYVSRGSSLSLNCSSSSPQQLSWSFRGASYSNVSLVSSSGSSLDFRIRDVQPRDQGFYSCRAQDPESHQTVNKSTELLVYYVPDRHPECSWSPAQDPAHFTFSCSWFGAYPTPTLRWGADQDHGAHGDQGAHGHQGTGWDYVTKDTESLAVTLNRSTLLDGQTLRCRARHLVLERGTEKTCSFTLKPPYPSGDPMAAALEGSSVTLTCSETVSIPPANTTWRRGLEQQDVVPGSKYVLSEDGPALSLTIHNVSRDDEGVYFCRSENPLAVRELEVYLTIKNSSAYTGAIIGVFIAVLIVGAAAIIAKTVYSSRHTVCLGGGFGRMEDDGGDVLSLVDSDDDEDQLFQDSVPRLPPLTNGHQTTLVQIHRIPSSDPEDSERPTDPLQDPEHPTDPLQDPKRPTDPLQDPEHPTDPLQDPERPTDPLQDPEYPTDPLQLLTF